MIKVQHFFLYLFISFFFSFKKKILYWWSRNIIIKWSYNSYPNIRTHNIYCYCNNNGQWKYSTISPMTCATQRVKFSIVFNLFNTCVLRNYTQMCIFVMIKGVLRNHTYHYSRIAEFSTYMTTSHLLNERRKKNGFIVTK